jgi:hypothetical protein
MLRTSDVESYNPPPEQVAIREEFLPVAWEFRML